jgi:hypothetical protein
MNYANACISKDGRILFDIKGNAYRLIAKFNFEKQWIIIRSIGTYVDHDPIDTIEIRMEEMQLSQIDLVHETIGKVGFRKYQAEKENSPKE